MEVDHAEPLASSINVQLNRPLATCYTGPMARTAREQALKGFRDGEHLILVATAAIEEGSAYFLRLFQWLGMDVKDCNMVIRHLEMGLRGLSVPFLRL